MSNVLAKKMALFLLLCSFNLLSLAVVYYEVEDDIVNFRYSDGVEYKTIQEGLEFLDKLPIQFNITNKYFSSFDNLDNSVREEILLAYAIKNNIKIYNCDGLKKCINKKDLEDSSLLDKFNSKTVFNSDIINIYIDDYGTNAVSKNFFINGYTFSLDTINNNNYRKYSSFSRYKEVDDMFVFYLYEGYYNGNCKLNDDLELYDFMSGNVIYKDKCNNNGTFSNISDKDISKLQLYKYELKKNKSGEFYLYGYNPVNK